ncbi:MAG TPA: hypothetical protein VNT99_12060 [Methylomirabilota bacterium]|nr:hypothetical protein [Methylomirabilota bacterium]
MATPNLSEFSTTWFRPKLSAKDLATLERNGLIERRNPKSALFRLSAKGEIVKYSESYRKGPPSA